MNKKIGAIYYTDNRALPIILQSCQDQMNKNFKGEIVSCSLKPINFGKNIVLKNRERSYPTMVRQIIIALENSTADYVFYLENDVLYHKSHFDFIPKEDNIFYYNSNVWRWRLHDNIAIRYDGMLPLSCMCANRKFALEHYMMRERKIKEWKLDEIRSREPRWARVWGYEPGRKSRKRGGFSDDLSDTWHSEYPNVDIRHKRTFSRLKCTQDDFIHPPINWQEVSANKIPGWDLKTIF